MTPPLFKQNNQATNSLNKSFFSILGVQDTTKYIEGQAEHHRKMTFKEEIEVFLKKHGMEYVERDLE